MPRNKTRKSDRLPSLVVPGDDHRAKMYDTIAQVHKQIVEAKWRARSAKVEIQVHPNLVMHHEDALAFLAEEVLRLQVVLEQKLESAIREAIFQAVCASSTPKGIGAMAEGLAVTEDATQEDST